MKKVLLSISILLAFAIPAQAKGYYHKHKYHHLTHHYSHYLTQRHFRYQHRRHFAHIRKHQHRDSFTLTRVKLPDGQNIVVNAPFADRFVGFFREVFDREWKLPEIGCYAAHGHMPLPWGRHPAGEACDVGQRSRNVAWRVMYHVTDIAHRWGLTDGCEWRGNPDCGHVQVNHAVAVVPAIGLHMAKAIRKTHTYQVAGAWPL